MNLSTPSRWLGARDTDSCSLENLVLGETFEGFEARHSTYLFSKVPSSCSERGGKGESIDTAEGSCYPLHRRGDGEVNQFKVLMELMPLTVQTVRKF